MATDVISTIGATSSPVTPDYTSCQAWEDAAPTNLVTDDKRWIGECLDQGTLGVCIFGGSTTDSTRYKFLRCASGASFKDKAGVRSTALIYSTANGVNLQAFGAYVIELLEAYCRVEGVQIKDTYTPTGEGFRGTSSVTGMQVSKCIAHQNKTRPYNITFANCLLQGAVGQLYQNHFYGCTFLSTISNAYANSVFKNCAIFNGSAYSGNLYTGSSYNATDLSSLPGSTNNVTSLTYADQFENSSSDWRAKSTGGLKAGTPDSTNTPDDITGLARDTTTPWIGCWEVAAAAAAGGLPSRARRANRSRALTRM